MDKLSKYQSSLVVLTLILFCSCGGQKIKKSAINPYTVQQEVLDSIVKEESKPNYFSKQEKFDAVPIMGKDNFGEFVGFEIRKNISKPTLNQRTSDSFFTQIEITANGKISSVSIMGIRIVEGTADAKIAKTLIAAIKKYGKWHPEIKDGKPISTVRVMPIKLI